MREEVLPLLEEHKADEQVLTGLAKAISIFPPMTGPFVLTICEIADAYIAFTTGLPTSQQVADFFEHDFYFNIGGVKTKSGQGPCKRYAPDLGRAAINDDGSIKADVKLIEHFS